MKTWLLLTFFALSSPFYTFSSGGWTHSSTKLGLNVPKEKGIDLPDPELNIFHKKTNQPEDIASFLEKIDKEKLTPGIAVISSRNASVVEFGCKAITDRRSLQVLETYLDLGFKPDQLHCVHTPGLDANSTANESSKTVPPKGLFAKMRAFKPTDSDKRYAKLSGVRNFAMTTFAGVYSVYWVDDMSWQYLIPFITYSTFYPMMMTLYNHVIDGFLRRKHVLPKEDQRVKIIDLRKEDFEKPKAWKKLRKSSMKLVGQYLGLNLRKAMIAVPSKVIKILTSRPDKLLTPSAWLSIMWSQGSSMITNVGKFAETESYFSNYVTRDKLNSYREWFFGLSDIVDTFVLLQVAALPIPFIELNPKTTLVYLSATWAVGHIWFYLKNRKSTNNNFNGYNNYLKKNFNILLEESLHSKLALDTLLPLVDFDYKRLEFQDVYLYAKSNLDERKDLTGPRSSKMLEIELKYSVPKFVTQIIPESEDYKNFPYEIPKAKHILLAASQILRIIPVDVTEKDEKGNEVGEKKYEDRQIKPKELRIHDILNLARHWQMLEELRDGSQAADIVENIKTIMHTYEMRVRSENNDGFFKNLRKGLVSVFLEKIEDPVPVLKIGNPDMRDIDTKKEDDFVSSEFKKCLHALTKAANRTY